MVFQQVELPLEVPNISDGIVFYIKAKAATGERNHKQGLAADEILDVKE